MKKLLIALLALASFAAVLPPPPTPPTYYLNLAWDDTNTTRVTYTVLVGTNSGSYFRWFDAGTNKQAKITGLSMDREPYYFAVMAVQGATNQSLPSVEFKWPWAATNSYLPVVQYSVTLNGASVDVPPGQWLSPPYNQGFFKLRLEQRNNILAYEHPE